MTTFKVRLEVYDVGDRTDASDDVVRVARPIFAELDADKEHFVLLALNNKNRLNGYKVISTGTLTTSLIPPGDVNRAALHLAAAAVVFVHNHPSGDPTTKQLFQYRVVVKGESLRRIAPAEDLEIGTGCGGYLPLLSLPFPE